MSYKSHIFYNDNCIHKMPDLLYNFLHKIIKLKGDSLEIRQRAGVYLPPKGFVEVWDSIQRKSYYIPDSYNLKYISNQIVDFQVHTRHTGEPKEYFLYSNPASTNILLDRLVADKHLCFHTELHNEHHRLMAKT